ncbi:hypothetical protein AcW1_005626 [Taiwanofungus camphoratus]|nr:hypothetical protein AcV5_005952 [Antrodia cinnamomea]KAI0957140.1 hypothetical protein AcW1_005626 [Antrodia cinnamomea]
MLRSLCNKASTRWRRVHKEYKHLRTRFGEEDPMELQEYPNRGSRRASGLTEYFQTHSGPTRRVDMHNGGSESFARIV